MRTKSKFTFRKYRLNLSLNSMPPPPAHKLDRSGNLLTIVIIRTRLLIYISYYLLLNLIQSNFR